MAPMLTAVLDPGDPVERAPFFRDPTFQKFYERAQADNAVVAEFRKALAEGRYPIADFEALKGTLGDAFCLYDVLYGKRSATWLIGAFEQHATPDVWRSILIDLHRFLELRMAEITRNLPPESDKLQ